MPKTYPEKIRLLAKRAYCLDAKTISQVSQQFGVGQQTLRKWRDEEDWDEIASLKEASLFKTEVLALEQINGILREAKEQNRRSTPAEIDMISKLQKLIASVKANVIFASNGIQATAMFLEFIKEKNQSLYEQLIPLSIEFTEQLAESAKQG